MIAATRPSIVFLVISKTWSWDLLFQLLKELEVEVPPEDEVVEEAATVVQELQEESLEDPWAGGDNLAQGHRGKRALVCVGMRQ